MAKNVFPTENSVGVYQSIPSVALGAEAIFGTGGVIRAGSRLPSFVWSGLDITSVSGLTVQASVGYAVINGFVVYVDAPDSVVMPGGSPTSYRLWLQLVVDGAGPGSGVNWVTTSGDTPPAGQPSVLVGYVPMGAAAPVGSSDPIQSAVKAPGSSAFTYT